MELLCEYDFGIEYKPGKENLVADALSRKSTLKAVTIPQASIMEQVHEFMPSDPYFSKIYHPFNLQDRTDKQDRQIKGFKVDAQDLYFDNRLCIPDPDNKQLKESILRESHDIPIAAHPGYVKMYHSLRQFLLARSQARYTCIC